MSKREKILVVVVLLLAVGVVIILKQRTSPTPAVQADVHNSPDTVRPGKLTTPSLIADKSKPLPRLLDLGAGKCIPCKMMAPILEELKNEYAGSMQVEVIDVEENPDIAEKYEVRIIPTQIFFDAEGKELFRHMGYISKQDILAKWRQLGVNLRKGQTDEKPI
jgi:thioredoxin 1